MAKGDTWLWIILELLNIQIKYTNKKENERERKRERKYLSIIIFYELATRNLLYSDWVLLNSMHRLDLLIYSHREWTITTTIITTTIITATPIIATFFFPNDECWRTYCHYSRRHSRYFQSPASPINGIVLSSCQQILSCYVRSSV